MKHTHIADSMTMSVLSERPHIFRGDNGRYYVSVDGLPMPYGVWTFLAVKQIYGDATAGSYRNSLETNTCGELENLLSDVALPARHTHMNHRSQVRIASLAACDSAVNILFRNLRKEKENAASEIKSMMRKLEDEYLELYSSSESETCISTTNDGSPITSDT